MKKPGPEKQEAPKTTGSWWSRLVNRPPEKLEDKPYHHIPEIFEDFQAETFMNDDWRAVSGTEILKYFIDHRKELDGQNGPVDFQFGHPAQAIPRQSKFFWVMQEVFGFRNRTSQVLMARNLLDSGLLIPKEEYLDSRTGKRADWNDPTLDRDRDVRYQLNLHLSPRAEHVYKMSLMNETQREAYLKKQADLFPDGDGRKFTTYTAYMARPSVAAPGAGKRLKLAALYALPLAGMLSGLYYIGQQSSQKTGPVITSPVMEQPVNPPSSSRGGRGVGSAAPARSAIPDPVKAPRFTSLEEVLGYFKQGRVGKQVYEISHDNGYYSYLIEVLPENGQAVGRWGMLSNVDRTQKEKLNVAFGQANISLLGMMPTQTTQPSSDMPMGNFIGLGIMGLLAFSLIYQIGQRRQGGGSQLAKRQLEYMERQLKHMEAMDDLGKHKGLLVEEQVATRLNEVGGNYVAKRELQALVDKIKNRLRGADVEIPRGILLEGPPGNGKTLMARALAGEAGIPFISISGSDFNEKLVGIGASRVADLFNQARQMAAEKGACILFIDEFDSLGRKRSNGMTGGASDERENTLNKLLKEMDGFESSANIFILAATNRKDLLDEALINRPSRFRHTIKVNNPQTDLERQEILEIHANRLAQKYNLTLEDPSAAEKLLPALSAICRGLSGDQLQGVVKNAVEIALSEKRNNLTLADCIEGYQTQQFGHLTMSLISRGEREKVAFHELGHMIAALSAEKTPFVISMKQRNESLGRVIIDPRSFGEVSHTKHDYLAQVLIAMGGVAGETLKYGDLGRTSGLAMDIDQSRKILRRMLTFAMFKNNFALDVLDLGKELTASQTELMNRVIDQAINTAVKILETVGLSTLEAMVTESLASPKEWIGPEAIDFSSRHLKPAVQAAIRQLAEDFFRNPSGDTTT